MLSYAKIKRGLSKQRDGGINFRRMAQCRPVRRCWAAPKARKSRLLRAKVPSQVLAMGNCNWKEHRKAATLRPMPIQLMPVVVTAPVPRPPLLPPTPPSDSALPVRFVALLPLSMLSSQKFRGQFANSLGCTVIYRFLNDVMLLWWFCVFSISAQRFKNFVVTLPIDRSSVGGV